MVSSAGPPKWSETQKLGFHFAFPFCSHLQKEVAEGKAQCPLNSLGIIYLFYVLPKYGQKGSQKEISKREILLLTILSSCTSPNSWLWDSSWLQETIVLSKIKTYVTDNVYIIQESKRKTIHKAFHIRKNYNYIKPKLIYEEIPVLLFFFSLISDLCIRELDYSLFVFLRTWKLELYFVI